MFSSAIHLVSYAFHTVSSLFHLASDPCVSFHLSFLVFSVARISELSALSIFARKCLASCFYSYVPILLFATLLFIEHASFLFFIQLVGRAALEHFSLYLLLFISLELFCGIAVFASPFRSLWRSYHFGVPRAEFTTGLGPVGVFPRHAQGIPPSIRAFFPFVMVYVLCAYLYEVRAYPAA